VTICGYHAVEESLRAGSRGTLFVSGGPSRLQPVRDLAREQGVAVRTVSAKELNRLCGHDRHQGVALLSEVSRHPARQKLGDALKAIGPGSALVLLLDELNDPRNFGAILRSADQLGVDLVVSPIRRSVSETAGVIRASAGASRHIPLIAVANLVQAIELCKGHSFWIYGADMNGKRLQKQRFESRAALVMGGEHRGLRRLVREACDFLVRIPSRGRVDSFNVSVAAGILLYEVRRQQGFPGFN
jgi:23S rRNA (guanosine2251-2'-O)-methyltransferase